MRAPLPRQPSIDRDAMQHSTMQQDRDRTAAAGSSRQLNPVIILAARLILDLEGRRNQARKMLNKVKGARPIYDIDDLREIPTHCSSCKRGLCVAGFMNKESQLLCIGCKNQDKQRETHQVVRLIGQDIELLERYLDDDTPMALPDLSQSLPRCDQVEEQMCKSHTMKLTDLQDLLSSLGHSHLKHGARNVGLDPEKSGKKLVHHVIEKLRGAQYFTTNLVVDTQCKGFQPNGYSSCIECWRSNEKTWKRTFGMTSNKTSTTMLIIGVAGTWTDWHVDYTEAHNYGMLLVGVEADAKASKLLPEFLNQYKPDKPEAIAVWYFVSPDGMPHAEAWLKLQRENGNGCSKQSFSEVAEWPMSVHELEAMDTYLKGRGHRIHKIEQCPGDKVYVPPGWGHTVINIKACAKVAWDLYDDRHWPQYLLASHRLHSKVTRERNASDYMEVESALLAQIKAEDYCERKGIATPYVAPVTVTQAAPPLMVTEPIELQRQAVKRHPSTLQSHFSNPEQHQVGQPSQVAPQPAVEIPQHDVELLLSVGSQTKADDMQDDMQDGMQDDARQPELSIQEALMKDWEYVQANYTFSAQALGAQQLAAGQLPTGVVQLQHDSQPPVHDATAVQGIHGASSTVMIQGAVPTAEDVHMQDQGGPSSQPSNPPAAPQHTARGKAKGKVVQTEVNIMKRTTRSCSDPHALCEGLVDMPADVKRALHEKDREEHGGAEQRRKRKAKRPANAEMQASLVPPQANGPATQPQQLVQTAQPSKAASTRPAIVSNTTSVVVSDAPPMAAGMSPFATQTSLPCEPFGKPGQQPQASASQGSAESPPHYMAQPSICLSQQLDVSSGVSDSPSHGTVVITQQPSVSQGNTYAAPPHSQQPAVIPSQHVDASPSVTQSPPNQKEQAAVGTLQLEVSPDHTCPGTLPDDAVPGQACEDWPPRYVTSQGHAASASQQLGEVNLQSCADRAQGQVPTSPRRSAGMPQPLNASMNITPGEMAQSQLPTFPRPLVGTSQPLNGYINLPEAQTAQGQLPALLRQSAGVSQPVVNAHNNVTHAGMAQGQRATFPQQAAGVSQPLNSNIKLPHAQMAQSRVPSFPGHPAGASQPLGGPTQLPITPLDIPAAFPGQAIGMSQAEAAPFPAQAYWSPRVTQPVLVPIPINLMHPYLMPNLQHTAAPWAFVPPQQWATQQPASVAAGIQMPVGHHGNMQPPVAADTRKRKRDEVTLSEAQMRKLAIKRLVNEQGSAWINAPQDLRKAVMYANMHNIPVTAPASPMDYDVVMGHT